jgi:RNA cap guanine-N2 methyltransferase
MSGPIQKGSEPIYDRAFLLHGPKRNEILTLREVQQYGIDSFSDADYVRVYGMAPSEWYGRGIRLLGRTAVECTRDALADRIGRDIADVAAKLPATPPFVVIDPFGGSCNTLYWILRQLPNAAGIAFELDPQVYALTKRNIAGLEKKIELVQGDYQSLLDGRHFPTEQGLVVFIAPPWGTALDELAGLDLRRTTPPISEIVGHIGGKYADHNILFAIQVYEKVNPDSLANLREILDWLELRIYDINVEGRNHGILLGTRGWKP